MEIIEIKTGIYSIIEDMENEIVLQELLDVLKKSNVDSKSHSFSNFEKSILKSSEKDIAEGRLYTNEEVEVEENQWLEE